MPGARVGEKAPPLLDYCEISGLNEREKFGVKHGRSGKRDGVHNMFAELFRHVRSGLVLSVSHRDVALKADACKRNEGDTVGVDLRIVSHNGTADSCPYHTYDSPVLLSFAGNADGDAGFPIKLVGNVPHAGGAGVDNDVFRFQFLNMDGFSAGKSVSHRDSGYQKLFKNRDKFDLRLR